MMTIFLSCTSEEQKLIPIPSETEKITLEIPFTKANEANEDLIKSGRIIVCKNTGTKDVIVNTNVPIQTTPDIIFKVEVPVGYMNIYLIGNEDPLWNLNGISNSNDLKSIKQFYTAYPIIDGNTIPMFEQYENVYVDENGIVTNNGSTVDLNNPLGTVKRIFSKVSLNLECVYNDLQNGNDPIQLDSVSIKRMPKHSYLVPFQNYTGTQTTDFFSGANANVANDFPYTGPSTNRTGFNGSTYFYIPEHIMGDTTYYTYLSIVVNLVGGATETQREYKLVVGDGIADGKNDYLLGPNKTVPDVIVTRNTHYMFDVKITSYTETSGSDLDIIAKIVDWDATPTDPKKPDEYSLSVSDSEIQIASVPFNGVINVTTDCPDGWSASSTSPGVNITGQGGSKLTFDISSGSSPWVIFVKAGKVERKITISQ